MHRIFTLCLLLAATPALSQQAPETMYTSGNRIYDVCGQPFIPRGVNYSLLDDWDFPGNLNNGELSGQIIQAQPNIVRIEWYVNYGQPSRPAYNLSQLDSVVSRFYRAHIVSVIELHDLSCSDDYNSFNSDLLSWWTSAPVVALLHKHRSHVLLNFANEFGQVNWANDPTAAQAAWTHHYENAIAAVRNAGIQVPLLIDAPDCGTSLDKALAIGAALNTADPLHRIIMSAHAYWYQNSAAQMESYVQSMAGATVPALLGELANVQDATGNCSNTIPAYQDLLQSCQNHSIGWLAWTWTDDVCADRRLSSDGQFSNLTAFGDVIVSNGNFGLAGHAVKACLEQGMAVREEENDEEAAVYPNPAQDKLFLRYRKPEAGVVQLSLADVRGCVVKEWTPDLSTSQGQTELPLPQLADGVYFLQWKGASGRAFRKIVVQH